MAYILNGNLIVESENDRSEVLVPRAVGAVPAAARERGAGAVAMPAVLLEERDGVLDRFRRPFHRATSADHRR